MGANAFELSGGPQNVERLCILREARPYHPVRSWELLNIAFEFRKLVKGDREIASQVR